MIKNVVNNDFSEVEKSAVALVDFNAVWCGPCRMLAPVLEELSNKFAGRVDFFSLDIDENDELTSKFAISSVPSIIMFKNGEKSAMRVGFAPLPILEQWIEGNI